MISSIDFKDIGKRFLLRFGSRYVDFWRNHNGRIFNYKLDTIKLKYLVKIADAKIIKKDALEGVYQLIDLANIEPETGFPINLEENLVDTIGSDKILLNGADLIFSKLNSHIGYVFLLSEISDQYEVIGSTEFLPLKVETSKIDPKLLKYFLLHTVFREKAIFLRSGKSQSHPRMQKDDFLNLEIPDIPPSSQYKIVNKINEIEIIINSLRKSVEPLQRSIDNVFIKYCLKRNHISSFKTESFVTDLKSISQNKSLRTGAEYNNFWLLHKGQLFDNQKNEAFDLLPLKRVLKLCGKTIIKKGLLSNERLLIDFEQVEAKSGKIIDFENIVTELGSDRLSFGNCDLLTNKLRPYLGYTIMNIPEYDIIGTTEFIPLEIRDKNRAVPEFIRYILLSNEYLEKSKFLMSGKEHPRISSADILNIIIPLPSKTFQIKIVEEIQILEEKSQNAQREIRKMRREIDNLILEELSFLEGQN